MLRLTEYPHRHVLRHSMRRGHRLKLTCPSDAAAIGRSEMELNTSAMGRPSSASMIWKACFPRHIRINEDRMALPGIGEVIHAH